MLKGALQAVTAADVYARGAQVLDKAVGQGATLIRTRAEIEPMIGLAGIDAVRQLPAGHAWALNPQICIFPQEGLPNHPGAEEPLRGALTPYADLTPTPPGTSRAPLPSRARMMRIWISISTPAGGIRTTPPAGPLDMACRAGLPSAM